MAAAVAVAAAAVAAAAAVVAAAAVGIAAAAAEGIQTAVRTLVADQTESEAIASH